MPKGEEKKAERETPKIETLEDLPGIGPKTAEKLIAAGFENIKAIAAAQVSEIASIIGDEDKAKEAIKTAKKAVVIKFMTAAQYAKIPVHYISTGSKAIDRLLGGGIRTRMVTTFAGPYGSGKTQIGFQLCCNVQLPVDKGGLDGAAFFIDSEGSFSPERLAQIAKASGLDPEKALERVYVAKVFDTDEMWLLTEQLDEEIPKRKIKVVVFDSFVGPFRIDFAGMKDLQPRSIKMRLILHRLQHMAAKHNIAVYATNQVMGKPMTMFGKPSEPVGGYTMQHWGGVHVTLERLKENKRKAILIDSPERAQGECIFYITEEGVRDEPE